MNQNSSNARTPPQLHVIAPHKGDVTADRPIDLSDESDHLTGWRLLAAWALAIAGPWAMVGWAVWWLA